MKMFIVLLTILVSAVSLHAQSQFISVRKHNDINSDIANRDLIRFQGKYVVTEWRNGLTNFVQEKYPLYIRIHSNGAVSFSSSGYRFLVPMNTLLKAVRGSRSYGSGYYTLELVSYLSFGTASGVAHFQQGCIGDSLFVQLLGRDGQSTTCAKRVNSDD